MPRWIMAAVLLLWIAGLACKDKDKRAPAIAATTGSGTSAPPVADPVVGPDDRPSEAECRTLQAHVFAIGAAAADLAAMAPAQRDQTLATYARNVPEPTVRKCMESAKRSAVLCMMKQRQLDQLPGCVRR